MKFGIELDRHIDSCRVSGCLRGEYVRYAVLKKAIKSGCTEAEFQRLFHSELDKFVGGLQSGALERDPLYTVYNRAALDKISKKFDKYGATTRGIRVRNWETATSSLGMVFSTLSIDDWSLVPPDLKPDSNAEANGEKSLTTIFIAGGASGIVSRSMTAPLDRVKIMLQAGAPKGTRETGSNPKEWQSGRVRNAARVIYKDSGVKGFWRGNGANILKVMPESAMKFVTYDLVKGVICSDPDEITIPERLVAGCTAGAVSQLAIYPLDVTKTRLAVSTTGTYSGIIDCIRNTVTREGPGALYRGIVPALVGIIPAAGIDLAVYNTLRAKYINYSRAKMLTDLDAEFKSEADERVKTPAPGSKERQKIVIQKYGSSVGRAAIIAKNSADGPPIYVSLGMGAISAMCGAVIGYPLSLIRTRLMAQGMPGRPERYKGMLDCGRSIIAETGLLGLYRGLTPALLKTVPAISIGYGAFELAKKGPRLLAEWQA